MFAPCPFDVDYNVSDGAVYRAIFLLLHPMRNICIIMGSSENLLRVPISGLRCSPYICTFALLGPPITLKGGSIRLQADTASQAGSMLPEFPATPLGRSLRFLEVPISPEV